MMQTINSINIHLFSEYQIILHDNYAIGIYREMVVVCISDRFSVLGHHLSKMLMVRIAA